MNWLHWRIRSVVPLTGDGAWRLTISLCRQSFFFFQAEDGIRDLTVTGVQTCALPIWNSVRQHETVLRFRSSLKLMCSSICGVPMRYAWAALQILDQQFCREWNHGIRQIGRASCRERV